jgi:hypothetical protein
MNPKIRKQLPALICSILAVILGVIVSDAKLALSIIGVILLFTVIPELIKAMWERKHHP